MTQVWNCTTSIIVPKMIESQRNESEPFARSIKNPNNKDHDWRSTLIVSYIGKP